MPTSRTTALEPKVTALVLVDPLHDFLAPDGLLWPSIAAVADRVGLHRNLGALLAAFRASGACVAFAPHRRWDDEAYAGWSFMTADQSGVVKMRVFARSGPGGDWHEGLEPWPGELVATEHFAQSGFANTDLEVQLRQRGITHLVVAGLLANTCVESTARFGMELGFHVTLVRDATAATSEDAMRAAHDVNGPTYAHWITGTQSVLEALA